MVDFCGIGGLGTFLGTDIMALTAYAGIVTAILVGLAYMAGQMLSNPKLLVWAKTEAVQVFVSIATVILLLGVVNTFCAIDVHSIASVFGVAPPPGPPVDMYTGAERYLKEAAIYAHNAMIMARYHLEGYAVLSHINKFDCDFQIGGIGLGCLFGYSGTNYSPLGSYGMLSAAMNLAMNTAMIAYFGALNFLMLLFYVYKGFVFLFLPLGIFFRSLPYMRGLGALFISLAICFVTIYPLMLAVFYTMGEVIVDRGSAYNPLWVGDPNPYAFQDESVFKSQSSLELSISAALSLGGGGEEKIRENYFPQGDNPTGALLFAGAAMMAAVLLPTAALLTTIASIAYVARLMGEELDLSRITQMV